MCVIIPRIFVLFKDNWVRYGSIPHLCINRKISISNIYLKLSKHIKTVLRSAVEIHVIIKRSSLKLNHNSSSETLEDKDCGERYLSAEKKRNCPAGLLCIT